jgi:tetratricopeptide (TPR) repeat protein
MAEDDLSRANRESDPPSFDFDEDAIATLLDTFVERQTGPRAKHVSQPPDPSDSGAQAAQRTVFQHTSRHEALPLVGDTPDTKNRRIELLEALAERAVGSARARLLTSAGELREQLGDGEAAAKDYQRALAADARDVVVLRALRRHAMRCQDWAGAAAALEKEAGLELSSAERASALKLLARILLSKLGDPAAAAQAATHAADLRPDDFVAKVLTAAARLARGDEERAAQALTAAAERWPQADAQAVMLLHAAQLMENAGALEPARKAFRKVLELQPALLAARLGEIRAARGLGEPEAAIEALHAAAERAPTRVATALRRTAAALSRGRSQHEAAIALLGQDQDTASLWTLAEAATLTRDMQSAIEALSGEPPDQTPEIRAVTSARRARLHAEHGEDARFEQASRDARHEPSLDPYLQAWRRLLSRQSEDGSVLRRLLETMSGEAANASSSMVRADDAAFGGDGTTFVAALERELEDAPDQLALGATLAIAEIADATGVTDRRTALRRAEERLPGEPAVGRALLLDDGDPERSARRWWNEGEATTGARSAFAFTMAARLAEPGSEAAIDACEAALALQADYWPALWELEDRLGSRDARAASASTQAMLDPTNAGSGTLRASIWTPLDGERFAQAEAASNRDGPDPLLVEHLFKATGGATEAAGNLLARAAGQLDLVPYLERAAASYRWAGLPDRAAKVLREACAARPDDVALRVQRKDAELQASEFARLADSAMRRAREATDDAEQLKAFCAMAQVDRLARRDMQSARLSLQSIAEMRPDHIPTARALEWDALRENDTERMRSSARRLLGALPCDSADRLARHRLIVELLRADSDIMQTDIDRLLCGIDDALEADPGLARQVLGAAYAKGEPLLGLQALTALQACLDDDLERGALALDLAHVLQQMGDPERALEVLDEAQNHPLAREGEARLLHAAKRWEDAAMVYQDAASRAKDRRRAAALWREAACIFEEELEDYHSAIDAWVAATNSDITYLDVYRRLASLYHSQGQLDALRALTDARIDAGADTPTLVGLLLEKARQRRERGDPEGVIDALTECLELDPHHFSALKELVDTHRAAEDWQGAAEALIRIARLKRSTDEEIWAFSQLAEIYDDHLQDLARAEASLRHVAKLAPTHIETLDQLASVLSRQGKARESARLLEELVRRTSSHMEERDYRIRLATEVESAGQARQAELMLENLRAEQPTDPNVILAVADYYERQGAAPAEAMHLNRAASDLRSAIDAHPDNESLWTTLVRVLKRRHGPGPASCAASAAIAIGHPASLFEGDVTTRNEALGEAKVPLSNAVDSIVAPQGLPPTVRRLFALCEHSFDKVLPFDASAWHLRRPSGPHRGLVEEVGAVAEVLGISEPRLRVTYVAPAACMPISGDPPTVVVGGNLHEMTTPRERVFLFARALKVASNHLAPALRARPEDLDVALLALLQSHEASRTQGPEPRQMQDLRKKLLKAVPRRWRDEVESLVLELRGSAQFSTRAVPFAITELGDRVALTLTGDVPSAVNALLKIAGHDVPVTDAGRLGAIQETPEAWAAVRFAISDAHFEARTQAGVDP